MQKGLEPTKRFSNRVENYVRYRPGYPAEIIALLRDECGLTPESVIADIGSGTGKLSELFLNAGCQVFGVEPNKEMRAAGERMNHPNFTSVDASAEETTLPGHGVNFITAGQAFHWFDRDRCRAEFLRILKPGGWIVIIWNDRRDDTAPFLVAYENLLGEFGTDYNQAHHRRADKPEVIRAFFGIEPRFKNFHNVQHFDLEGLKGRLLSSSYAPVAGHPKYEEMLAELKQIFDTHQKNGTVAFEYDTHLYYGHLV
ncbi:MAG TPA: class I SAM-dependent methyltransferase [Candidatus Acidoferrales bacterium]|jgi:SAM-dependent methyltransferase|nr:class I SAM-dependent methyltransferase [Candidatus Acidoferrales bacterium]